MDPRSPSARGFWCGPFVAPRVAELRRDLPVLLVCAEGDLEDSRAYLAALFPRILESGAPWTVEIATGLPHAFDAFSDNDAARRTIQRTISPHSVRSNAPSARALPLCPLSSLRVLCG